MAPRSLFQEHWHDQWKDAQTRGAPLPKIFTAVTILAESSAMSKKRLQGDGPSWNMYVLVEGGQSCLIRKWGDIGGSEMLCLVYKLQEPNCPTSSAEGNLKRLGYIRLLQALSTTTHKKKYILHGNPINTHTKLSFHQLQDTP